MTECRCCWSSGMICSSMICNVIRGFCGCPAIILPGELVRGKVGVGRGDVLAGRPSRAGRSDFNGGLLEAFFTTGCPGSKHGTPMEWPAGGDPSLKARPSVVSRSSTRTSVAKPSSQSTDLIGTAPSRIDATGLNGQSFSLPCQATCAQLSRNLWMRSMQEPCMITGRRLPVAMDLLSFHVSRAVGTLVEDCHTISD